jgi:hypothetical protein
MISCGLVDFEMHSIFYDQNFNIMLAIEFATMQNALDHLLFFLFFYFNFPINYNSVLFQKICWLFYIPSQYVYWMVCGLTKLIVSDLVGESKEMGNLEMTK